MVDLALILGIYSYAILSLGLLGLLYKIPVFLITVLFVVGGVTWFKKRLHFDYLNRPREVRKDRLILVLLGLLGIQIIINFLGAISPELSFDALWYHLTAAKLYAQNYCIFYIPGWLLWPANLPRFTEMFYTVALLFSNEILAKLIHFTFGILSLVALIKLLRRYLSLRMAFLGGITFYTMLIVGWLSTTAYIDLTRTFFEILALDLFLQWYENKKEIHLYESAILTGLAISTKIFAFGSLIVFLVLLLIIRGKERLKHLALFLVISVLVVSPWLIFSAIYTGNPIYPLYSSVQEGHIVSGPTIPWFFQSLAKMPLLLWRTTITPGDIISPVFLIFLPLVLLFIWRENPAIKIAALYFLIGSFLAESQSNRYLLPYLPALTLVTLSVLSRREVIERIGQKFIITIILFCAILNLGGRALATRKFVPYLLGKQSKSEFLANNLNFSYGDFYDVDGWFAENIQKDYSVLVYNVHNLYYVDFPYAHESWARKGTYFTHILMGNNEELPAKFGNKVLIYYNPMTKVRVYVFADGLK